MNVKTKIRGGTVDRCGNPVVGGGGGKPGPILQAQ
jgi:hypothetical protein